MDEDERKALLIRLRFEAAQVRQSLRDSENMEPDPERTDVLLEQLKLFMALIEEIEKL